MDIQKGIKLQKLIRYVTDTTTEHYLKNDAQHGVAHRDYVAKRAAMFAKQSTKQVDQKSVFVGAMFHDAGHHIDPQNHETVSAQMCVDDKTLKVHLRDNGVYDEEIYEIARGIADHRASLKGEPRNEIGRIISSADRRVDLTDFLKSMYTYRAQNCPQMSGIEIIEDSWNYMSRKFGNNGYALKKMYFKDPAYEALIQQVKQLASDKQLFMTMFSQIIANCNKSSENLA